MLEELNKYKFIKKSNSELETDRIVNNITNKLWEENGYDTVFYLGSITQLKILAECLSKYKSIGQYEILGLINTYRTRDDVSDEIKNLAAMILDEFDYKEND